MEANLLRLARAHKGLRVIGDIHGNAIDFAAAVREAMRADLLVLVLGDVIDYGPDSPRCMEIMLQAVTEGRAVMIPGNHDAKFLRWIRGHKVSYSQEALGETIRQLRAHDTGIQLSHRYAAMLMDLPLWHTAGTWHFVHAGFSPEMLRRPATKLGVMGRPDKIDSLALNGETDGAVGSDGKVLRTYGWLDLVPRDMTICIGHDVAAFDRIVERRGRLGGRLLHLDTGSGEGGRLSWIDIPLDQFTTERTPHRRRRSRGGRTGSGQPAGLPAGS